MGYPAKLMNLSALLAKVETTYGTAVAVTATADGHLLALSDRYPGLLTMGYVFDGQVGPAPGNLGMLKRLGTLGRTVTGQIPMRAKGAAATYASTVLPNIHTMLKISGFDATLGGGFYTYTPTADSITYSSATMEYYKRGEKWTSRGTLANWSFTADNPGAPIHLFDIRGIADTAVADATMVAPTYPTLTTAEPLATGITCAIGSYTAPVIRSAAFNMNRNIDNPRINLNAADLHEGFVPNGYEPELRLVVESTALTYPTAVGGFDPYKMRLNAEAIAVSVTIGSTSFNKYTVSLPQAQLAEYTLQNDGPIGTVELVFKGYNSSPIVQTDAVVVTFN
jgi:hypothetical protein